MKTVLYGECVSEEVPVLAPSPAHMFSSPIVSHHASFVSSCVISLFLTQDTAFLEPTPRSVLTCGLRRARWRPAPLWLSCLGNLADGTLLSDAQRHLVAAPSPPPLLSHTALPDQSICVRTYVSHSLRLRCRNRTRCQSARRLLAVRCARMRPSAAVPEPDAPVLCPFPGHSCFPCLVPTTTPCALLCSPQHLEATCAERLHPTPPRCHSTMRAARRTRRLQVIRWCDNPLWRVVMYSTKLGARSHWHARHRTRRCCTAI